MEQERADLDRLWKQRRERAAYEVGRAERQYQAVEPENRLVARTLERAWEEKLAAQQQLDEDYHRFVREQPRVLTADEREAIRQLAADIPSLWYALTTTAADRKEIVRQVVERVVVDAQGTSEQVRVHIDWVGGGHTESTIVRPVRNLSDLSSYPQICARVRQLTQDGWVATAIADQLDAEGYHPARAGVHFSAQTIRALQHELAVTAPRTPVRSRSGLGADEWWPAELSRTLDIPKSSLYHWIKQGIVQARQLDEPLHRWVITADLAELERLRGYREQPRHAVVVIAESSGSVTEGLH